MAAKKSKNASKRDDKSYDKAKSLQPGLDLESRLKSVVDEIDALEKAKDRSADWYFIYQIVSIAYRYVQKRQK